MKIKANDTQKREKKKERATPSEIQVNPNTIVAHHRGRLLD
jgi:hypothetical protein